MTRQYFNEKRHKTQESASPIEALRIERTKLSQAEFAVHCGIPLRTYQRWVSGETEAKPTPRQWKVMMRVLQIQSFEEVPDDFARLIRQGMKIRYLCFGLGAIACFMRF